MELDAGAGTWCGARILHCHVMPDLNAVLCDSGGTGTKVANSNHQIPQRVAPLRSDKIDFRVCASPRAGTYTLVVSSAAEDYSEVPNRCSGVLEAPVGLQNTC